MCGLLRIFCVWSCHLQRYFYFISNWNNFISCHIDLARTSSTMLSRNSWQEHPCFVSGLREKAFSLSPLHVKLDFYSCSLSPRGWFLLFSFMSVFQPSFQNPTWLWCIILFMYCWSQFANILLRIFCIYIYTGYWYLIFLYYLCLVLTS